MSSIITELTNRMEEFNEPWYNSWSIVFKSEGDWQDTISEPMTYKGFNNIIEECSNILDKIEDYEDDYDEIVVYKEISSRHYDECDEVFTLWKKKEEVEIYKIDWNENDCDRITYETSMPLEDIKDDNGYVEGSGNFEEYYFVNDKPSRKPLDKSLYEEEPVGYTFITNGNILDLFNKYFDTKTLMKLNEDVDECRQMYIYKATDMFDFDTRTTFIDMIFSFEDLDGVFHINYNGSSMFALWNCCKEYTYYDEEDEDDEDDVEKKDNKEKDYTDDLIQSLREAEKQNNKIVKPKIVLPKKIVKPKKLIIVDDF